MNKLTLTEFREIKNSMLHLIELEEQSTSSKIQDQSEEERILREFISLQDRLLSSDLSDIPFEEWKGLYMFKDGELDLSKTHANIDFSLLAGIGYDRINLQGCNIRGIQLLDYDDNTFDAEYKKAHPEYFPDDSIPAEVRKLFYAKKLTFSDLIEYPDLRKCVNEYSFENLNYSPSRGLVKAIGFENAIKLFDENPNFVNEITFKKERSTFSLSDLNFNAEKPFDKSGTYEEAKKFIYRQILEEVKHSQYKKLPSFDVIPQEMIESFPNHLFIKEGELPEKVAKDYYEGKLSISEIRQYSEVLKTKDLEFGTRSSKIVSTVNKVFGNVWKFIEQVPMEYNNIIEEYLEHSAHNNEKIVEISHQELSNIISDSIRHTLHNKPQSKYKLDELYAFSQYVPIEEIFKEVNLRDFIQKCGFENIVDFNRRNDMILERTGDSYQKKTLLQEMAEHANVIGENVLITDEKQLADVFRKIIHQIRSSNDYSAKELLNKNKRELCTLYPSEFLDYNMLDTLLKNMKEKDKEQLINHLESGFNGSTDLLFEILNENPLLLPAFRNKSLIINENNWRLNLFYQKVGSEMFLNIASKYGITISKIISTFNYEMREKIEEVISQIGDDNYEHQINLLIYYYISEQDSRLFDLRTLPQSFKSEYPELYLDENAPKELQDVFYGRINHSLLGVKDVKDHPEWIPFLMKVDLRKSMNLPKVRVYNLKDKDKKEYSHAQEMNLYEALDINFSKEEILNFISKYGHCLNNSNFSIDASLNKEEQYERIITDIYNLIKKGELFYNRKNMPGEFIKKYRDIFLDENAPEELQEAFYNRTISLEFILANPSYREYLKSVDLEVLFRYMPVYVRNEKYKYGRVNLVNGIKQIFGSDNAFDIMLLYRKYIEKIFDNNGLRNFEFNPNFSKEDLLNELDKTILQNIIDGNLKYDENISSHFKDNNPTLFLKQNTSQEIKNKFYNREFTLKDFNDNPELFEVFYETNIACGFSESMSWIIPLFKDSDNIKTANYNRMRVISAYSKIQDVAFKKEFKEYIMGFENDIDVEKIEYISEVLSRLSLSNSSEIFTFRKELATQILKSNNPFESLTKVEDIFIKNNLPVVGKIFSCFEILHPDFQGFNFEKSSISPMLKKSSTTSKKIIVFSDLIKSSFGSNNRSVNTYLENIEFGFNLYEKLKTGHIQFDSLNDMEKQELVVFSNHLATLYNNTMKAKKENETFISSDDVLNDIMDLSKKLSPNGTLDYNLADRVVKMFCGLSGIKSLEQAKKYINDKVKSADERNRKAAEYDLVLEKGDFIKGIGDIKYLENILQNGSISKEYLGSSAGSDLTPLDTDVSMIMSSDGTISEKMEATAASNYGPIWFVLKNDNRFITTRTSSEKLEAKRDLTKLEVFYTGVHGQGHYGIRTGFASSEINYIVMDNYDSRVGLEIAMNGFYIPVANKEGKIIFTPKDYDELREKMNGLSYYGIKEFRIDDSINIPDKNIDAIIKDMEEHKEQTEIKSQLIKEKIKKQLPVMNLKVNDKIDLALNSVTLFNTGSTSRFTNLPGSGDFDFIMQVDRELFQNPNKMQELQKNIISTLGGEYNLVNNDIRELKTKIVDADGKEHEFDIDISFVQKTDKTEYASDICANDRLKSIQSDEDRKKVIANIIYAKRFAKSIDAYKPSGKDPNQGGLGGIGIENWILQNGGSFYKAAKTFVECSDECKSFEEFQSKYHLYNFGINHMAEKKGQYPHNDFITNMNKTGYDKMVSSLRVYVTNIEKETLERKNSKNNDDINFGKDNSSALDVQTDKKDLISEKQKLRREQYKQKLEQLGLSESEVLDLMKLSDNQLKNENEIQINYDNSKGLSM